MKVTRAVVAVFALAVAAACTSSPTAPDTTAELGKMGSGLTQAPSGTVSYGKMGSGL